MVTAIDCLMGVGPEWREGQGGQGGKEKSRNEIGSIMRKEEKDESDLFIVNFPFSMDVVGIFVQL